MKFPWGWKALCELRSQCSRWLSVCQSNTCQSWGGEGGLDIANNCFLFSRMSTCNVWLHVLTFLFKMKSRMASSLLPEHLKLTFVSNLYWRRCAPHDSGWIANHDDPILHLMTLFSSLNFRHSGRCLQFPGKWLVLAPAICHCYDTLSWHIFFCKQLLDTLKREVFNSFSGSRSL